MLTSSRRRQLLLDLVQFLNKNMRGMRYEGQHLCLELGCVPDVTLTEDRSGQSCQGQGQETRRHHPGLLAAGDTLALPASREHLARWPRIMNTLALNGKIAKSAK